MAGAMHIHVTAVFVAVIGSVSVDYVQSKALWDRAWAIKDSSVNYPLIVISFDGFRWDYLQRTSTPHFDKFLENGVTARYGLKNAFVTKTFPNHFTLATGLWEESHGIVANDMFDPYLNQSFSPRNVSANSDPAWFNVGAEPIWVTNQLQVFNGRSGVIMWVGGGAPIKWVRPSRYVPYNTTIKNETKVDMLIDWFMDKDPINLGMIYFDEPDGFGHKYGPNSTQVTQMIAGLDKVVGYLLKKLEENGLLEHMNIILTSDHGFAETPSDKAINLDDHIDPTAYEIYSLSPIAGIWPHEGKLEEIYQNLTVAAAKLGTLDVYRREDVPAYFHYTNNRRISPVVVVAHDTYSFCTGKCISKNLGDHGYDNRLQDMHPFFLAMGPSFKKNFSVDTFDNVDVYPLMCHLLGLRPAPNNGSLKIVSDLLVGHEVDFRMALVTYVSACVLVIVVGGVFAASACQKLCGMKKGKYREYSSITEKGGESAVLQETGAQNSLSGLPEKYTDSTVPLLLQQQHDDDAS